MGYFAELKVEKDNETTLQRSPSPLSGEERSYVDVIDKTFYQVKHDSRKMNYYLTDMGKAHEEVETWKDGTVVTTLVLDSGDVVATAYVEDRDSDGSRERSIHVVPNNDFTTRNIRSGYTNNFEREFSVFKKYDSNGRISELGEDEFIYFYRYSESGNMAAEVTVEDIGYGLSNVTRIEYRDDGQIDNIAKVEIDAHLAEGGENITRSDILYTYDPDGRLVSKKEDSLTTHTQDARDAMPVRFDDPIPGEMIYYTEDTTEYYPDGSVKRHEKLDPYDKRTAAYHLNDREFEEYDEQGRTVIKETINCYGSFDENEFNRIKDRQEYSYDADGNTVSEKHITSDMYVELGVNIDEYRAHMSEAINPGDSPEIVDNLENKIRYMTEEKDLPEGVVKKSQDLSYKIYENGHLKEDGREYSSGGTVFHKENNRYYPDGQVMNRRSEELESAAANAVAPKWKDYSNTISRPLGYPFDFGNYTSTQKKSIVYSKNEKGFTVKSSVSEKHINSATNMQMETTYTDGDKSSMTLKVFGIDGTEKSRLEEAYGVDGSVSRSVYENGVLISEVHGMDGQLPDLHFTAEWEQDANNTDLRGNLSYYDGVIRKAVTYDVQGQPLNAEAAFCVPERGVMQSDYFTFSPDGGYTRSARNAEGVETRFYEHNPEGEQTAFITHKDDGLICETKHVRAFITDEPVIMEDVSHGQALSSLGEDSPLYNEQMDKNYSAAVIFNPKEESITVYTDYAGVKDGLDKVPAAYMERVWGKDTRGDGWEARSPEGRRMTLGDLVSTIDSMELYAEPAVDTDRANETGSIHAMTVMAVREAAIDRGLGVDALYPVNAKDAPALDGG